MTEEQLKRFWASRRKHEDLAKAHILFLHGLKADEPEDARQTRLTRELKKKLSDKELPTKFEWTYTKTGALSPIGFLHFPTTKNRMKVEAVIKAMADLGGRVMFGDATDRINKMMVGASKDIYKSLGLTDRAEQRVHNVVNGTAAECQQHACVGTRSYVHAPQTLLRRRHR